MNKIALALISFGLACGTFSVNADNWKDRRKTFGVYTGLVTKNTSADAGVMFKYRFSHVFRLGADADIVFKHKGRDAFLADINAEIPIDFSDKVEFYPLAGANYSSWSIKNDDDNSGRSNHLGVNLGAGLVFKVTPSMRLNLQAAYTLVKHDPTARINFGIGYAF